MSRNTVRAQALFFASLFVGEWGSVSGQTTPPVPPPVPQQTQSAPAPPPAPLQNQSPPAVAPSLSPGAIYKQAMRPLDLVRASLENWSDAELGALSVGMHMANQACTQAKPEDYSGDDLYDLARLCSFGQAWNDANSAATRYLDSRAEPHRAQAYALSINALMHLNGADLAVVTADAMMRGLPYDAEVAYTMRYLKDALEQSGNPAAMQLAQQEHAAIDQALQAGAPLKAVHGDAVISLGALYESAMELAFWQRYTRDNIAAAGTVKDVDASLPATAAIPPEDALRIDGVRKQYALLGTRVPDLKVAPVPAPVQVAAKAKVKTGPGPLQPQQIGPDFGAATILVLFPDWCPQCRRMMKTLTQFGDVNKDTPVHAYGLMFPDEVSIAGQTPEPSAAHTQNIKEVEGTSTLLVGPDAAQALGALDYPFAVVLDHAGIVRYAGVISGDAFNGNGYIEKVLIRMGVAELVSPKPPVKTN